MVSPGNPGDETRGGILSKDFGFRRDARLRTLAVTRCWVAASENELKNFGPGRMAARLRGGRSHRLNR